MHSLALHSLRNFICNCPLPGFTLRARGPADLQQAPPAGQLLVVRPCFLVLLMPFCALLHYKLLAKTDVEPMQAESWWVCMQGAHNTQGVKSARQAYVV